MKKIIKNMYLLLFLTWLSVGDSHCQNNRPAQPRDLEKFPFASMYYQDLYRNALETRDRLDKITSTISYGEAVVPPLKGFERTKAKVDADYQGNWRKITDIVRGSISFQNMNDLKRGISDFSREFPLIYVKDRIAKPTPSGYMDILALFRDPVNGIIGEIQFHLCHILNVKDEGHKFYELEEKIRREALLRSKSNLTPEEQKQLDEAVAAQKKIYATAKSDMDLGVPCSVKK